MFGAVYYQVIDFADFAHRIAHASLVASTSSNEHVRMAIQSLAIRKRRHGGELIFAIEGGVQERRLALHPGYKASRRTREPGSSVNELRSRMSYVYELVRCVKGRIIQCPGFEGDDAVAAFVHANPDRTLVFSADSDLWSLIDYPHVDIYTSGDDVLTQDDIDKKFTNGKWELPPSNVQMFKAVFGDATDDVPGVPHLRRSTVAACFATPHLEPGLFFSLVDQLCNDKTRQVITTYRDQIATMYEVVRLRREGPIVTQACRGDRVTLEALCHNCGIRDLGPQINELT